MDFQSRPTWLLDFSFSCIMSWLAPFPCLQLQPGPCPFLESHSGLQPTSNVECSLRPPGLCYSLPLPGTLPLHYPLPFVLISLCSDIVSRKLSLLHPSDFTRSLTHITSSLLYKDFVAC